jgi:hypothetical protein
MNYTGWRNDVKRISTIKRQIEIAIALVDKPQYSFREPVLNKTVQKKSIAELATICNLPYKDGKVG